jgi:hypothetical protein
MGRESGEYKRKKVNIDEVKVGLGVNDSVVIDGVSLLV